QLVQLGFLPHVSVRHTSKKIIGQIYVPAVNWFLLAAVVALVLGFRTSSHLASAYGIAVTGTFATTTTLASVVFRTRFHKPLWMILPIAATLLTIELSFFFANLPKVVSGGWLPLVVGAVVFTTLTTWRRGQALVVQADRDDRIPLRRYLNRMIDHPQTRVPGTAVFLTTEHGQTPPALIRNVDQNHVVHEQVVLLEIKTVSVPQVPDDLRITIERLRLGFVEVTARVGYQEESNVVRLLRLAKTKGLDIDLHTTSFFLDHTILQPTGRSKMAGWRKRYFLLLHRNAAPASRYLHIPPDAILEVGRHIEI
ncbi:MAG TPA: KUP/HAK/KT family potassium transporter, partial [Thermoleophilia bacterium]|nr:KUP/HAK/KT family potassium transporter [Thermoleophilia bacterium]